MNERGIEKKLFSGKKLVGVIAEDIPIDTDASIVAAFAARQDLAGLLVGAAFWTAEGRIREPMLPPVFFANRVRTVAVVCAALMGFVFYGTLFLMSLYFQLLRGWSPGSTGVALLPLTVGTLAGPFLIYRRLSRRFGHPVLLVAGFACCTVGVAVLAPTDAHTAYAQIAFGLLLIGLASTVSFSALTSLLLEARRPMIVK